MEKFRRLYIAELQELRSAEAQQLATLPELVDAAQHPELTQVLTDLLEQTRLQLERVELLLAELGADPKAHVDQAMQALLAESLKGVDGIADPDVMDAELIASLQRIKHYEIAAYGTVSTYATALGLANDHRTLYGILDEEREADRRLTELAKGTVNRDAAAA
jgi:ferritin-like metal-binding protein YciE